MRCVGTGSLLSSLIPKPVQMGMGPFSQLSIGITASRSFIFLLRISYITPAHSLLEGRNFFLLPSYSLYPQTCVLCVSFVEVLCSEDNDAQFLALRSVAQRDEHRAKVLPYLHATREEKVHLTCLSLASYPGHMVGPCSLGTRLACLPLASYPGHMVGPCSLGTRLACLKPPHCPVVTTKTG